jgi:hypothetical protein
VLVHAASEAEFEPAFASLKQQQADTMNRIVGAVSLISRRHGSSGAIGSCSLTGVETDRVRAVSSGGVRILDTRGPENGPIGVERAGPLTGGILANAYGLRMPFAASSV